MLLACAAIVVFSILGKLGVVPEEAAELLIYFLRRSRRTGCPGAFPAAVPPAGTGFPRQSYPGRKLGVVPEEAAELLIYFLAAFLLVEFTAGILIYKRLETRY